MQKSIQQTDIIANYACTYQNIIINIIIMINAVLTP